jgi:hypothetical protein
VNVGKQWNAVLQYRAKKRVVQGTASDRSEASAVEAQGSEERERTVQGIAASVSMN